MQANDRAGDPADFGRDTCVERFLVKSDPPRIAGAGDVGGPGRRLIEEVADADAEHRREFRRARQRHAVGAALVFLDLLEAKADGFAEALLAEACAGSREFEIATGDHIDRMRLSLMVLAYALAHILPLLRRGRRRCQLYLFEIATRLSEWPGVSNRTRRCSTL